MSIVLRGLHINTEIKQNKTNGVISIQVLEGCLKLVTHQQNTIIGAGQMIVIQGHFAHDIIALTESTYLLTVHHEQS
jgi:dTDP-4-dehydrorhamnose 3,5-epimerase-like enzyme